MAYLGYLIPEGTAITLPEYPEMAVYVVAGNVRIDRYSITNGVMAASVIALSALMKPGFGPPDT